MVRFDLAYGKGTTTVEVPEENFAGTLALARCPASISPERSPRRGGVRLDDRSGRAIPTGRQGRRRGHRPHEEDTHATRVSLVWEHLKRRVAREDVTLLVATGTHRASTDDELEKMLATFAASSVSSSTTVIVTRSRSARARGGRRSS